MENSQPRVFAFDHEHEVGDYCSLADCAHARRAPVLAGNVVLPDLPMRITSKATREQYLDQEVPEGWVLPPLEFGCDHFYLIETDELG